MLHRARRPPLLGAVTAASRAPRPPRVFRSIRCAHLVHI
ncbi:hypothetical protein X805_09840 [Sphaerotilus natans subsp. natans DSM 6575]|uniref:Uncharacterized protein n=1 Tax=Sphaerotilus natans subsp. natans DSM 6575 TaxID=1286631 RepID=A0A059KQ88_9BURK|nr:hypothetical protein X805_09840 [Sphaerotilus natans subsp. natans DSM 6575]